MFPLNNFIWPVTPPHHEAAVVVIQLTSWHEFFLSDSSLGMLDKNVFHIFSRKKEKKVESHKSRFNVSVVIFYGFSCDWMPVSYSRRFGRLARFIHPGFDTWCRPATATKKKKGVQLLLWCCTGGGETGTGARVAESAFWSRIWWYTGVIKLQPFLNWRRAIQQEVGAGFLKICNSQHFMAASRQFVEFKWGEKSCCFSRKLVLAWNKRINRWIHACVHGRVAIVATFHEHKFNPGTDSRLKGQIFSPEIAPSVYFVTETENRNTNNKPLASFYNHILPPPPLLIFFLLWASLALHIHQIYLSLAPFTLLACTFEPDLFLWFQKKSKKNHAHMAVVNIL